jgi:hypothetical protein
MTAILLNDGEIGAPGQGKCVPGSLAREIAMRTTDAAGKIISAAFQSEVLHIGQGVKSI